MITTMSMQTALWVAIDNAEAGEENQPDVWWYYFQANGKAYKNSHSSGNIFKKVINGKTYAFDEDGKMQYGWVKKEDGVTNYDDNAYQECDYYFGDENDGAMSVGWREIALTDVADAETEQPGDSYWDSDQVRWFYFKSSGVKQTSSTNKTINGRKYGFDEWGRMIADWHAATANDADNQLSRRGSNNNATATATKSYAKEFMYFSSPEDGARFTKGWFKVVPGYYLNYKDYDDGTDRWYYANGDGKIAAGEIKAIKGKKYAFDLKGGMISGLAMLRTSGNDILEYADNDGKYDSQESFEKAARRINTPSSDWGFYYFSDNEDKDGSMKTGNQRITLDGTSFTFSFKKGGTKKGQGINGMNEKKYYLGGMLMTADADNKIELLNKNTLERVTVGKFVLDNHLVGKDVNSGKVGQANKGDVVYTDGTTGTTGTATGLDISSLTSDYVVINVSGNVVKSGSKVDGDGFKVVLDGNNKVKQIIGTN